MINLERIEAELEALRIEIRELSKSTDADAALMITRLKAQETCNQSCYFASV